MSRIESNDTMTQDEFLESKMLEMMESKLSQIEANEVTLGVQIQKIDKSDGKIKVDKEGVPVVDAVTGEVLKWSDSYYATLSFNGGEVKQKVSFEQKIILENGKRFVAKGKLKQFTSENNQSYLKPEFTEFYKIF